MGGVTGTQGVGASMAIVVLLLLRRRRRLRAACCRCPRRSYMPRPPPACAPCRRCHRLPNTQLPHSRFAAADLLDDLL